MIEQAKELMTAGITNAIAGGLSIGLVMALVREAFAWSRRRARALLTPVFPGQKYEIPCGPEVLVIEDAPESGMVWIQMPDGEKRKVSVDDLRGHAKLLPHYDPAPSELLNNEIDRKLQLATSRLEAKKEAKKDSEKARPAYFPKLPPEDDSEVLRRLDTKMDKSWDDW